MAEVTNLNIKTNRELKTKAANARATVSTEQRWAAMQEIRDLLSDVDGSGIDLDQMRAERRAAKCERTL